MMMATSSKTSSSLEKEILKLREEIAEVRGEYRRNNQTRRALALSFLRGTTSALGALATVVIVMPAILWALRSVEWPPLISGFVNNVIQQIELANRQNPPSPVDQ